MSAQTLLFSEELQFSPDEFSVLIEIIPYLKKLGFRIKENGQNKILLEAIPSDMSYGSEDKVIKDILDNYISNRKNSSSFMEDIAASFACYSAVKAGDSLSIEEMQILVKNLLVQSILIIAHTVGQLLCSCLLKNWINDLSVYN